MPHWLLALRDMAIKPSMPQPSPQEFLTMYLEMDEVNREGGREGRREKQAIEAAAYQSGLARVQFLKGRKPGFGQTSPDGQHL